MPRKSTKKHRKKTIQRKAPQSAVENQESPAKSVSEGRTAWHVFFIRLLKQKGPRSFEVTGEFPFGKEPQRADSLLLRRTEDRALDSTAEVLKELWGKIDKVAVLEFKSISAPFAKGDLYRLLGYGFQYIVMAENLLPTELVLVLVVSNCNAVLKEEIATLHLNWVQSENGYHVVEGQSFGMLVIELDVVVEHEKDALLSMFAQHRMVSTQALVWWQQQTGSSMANLKDLEHFDDVVRSFVESLPLEQRLAGLAPEQRVAGLAPEQIAAVLAPEQRLAGLAPEQIAAALAPEQRLAGLAPEQRVAGLAPEQRLAGLAPEQIVSSLAPEQRLVGLDEAHAVLALPLPMLRALSADYINNLPQDIQDEVQRRLGSC